jgi:hypothetical protein
MVLMYISDPTGRKQKIKAVMKMARTCKVESIQDRFFDICFTSKEGTEIVLQKSHWKIVKTGNDPQEKGM